VPKSRKFILSAGALLLPLSTVLIVGAVGVGPAWAKKVDQPGTVVCSKIAGSFKFSPPLKATATSSNEKVSVKSTATDCVATGGATPTKGTTNTTTTFTSNGCAAVLEGSGKPAALTTKWSPGSIAPTTTSFPAPTATTSPTITLSYGGPGTSSEGSYPGSDGGAKSKVTIDIEQTESQIEASCETSAGLKTLTISGGSATGA
jgi:hypothetical protein